jgi:hypothetical protein
MIQLPYLIQVNEIFSLTTTIKEYDATVNLIDSSIVSTNITLKGEEDIKVIAGSFAGCLKFSIREAGDPDELLLWLAPGIGEVKSVCPEYDRELVSYTGCGKTYCPGS